MSKKIVTNLRIDEHEWVQVKAMAADRGISVNEYIKECLKEVSTRRMLAAPLKDMPKKKKKRASFWTLAEDLKKIKMEPMGDLSEDDKIIYET